MRNKNPGKGANPPRPSPARLAELLHLHGIDLTGAQVDQLWAFHRFLRERNRELNMTRIHNFENMVAKHYADCMLVAGMAELPSPLMDIGTGAGFPAIPLKIFRPDLHIIMVEGRKKRVAFLQEAVDLVGLTGIEAVARKIDRSFERTVAGVITRAVEKAPSTLNRIRSFLQPGGLAVFMKGPLCDEEVALAQEEEGEAYTLLKDESYTIPHTPHRRRLLVFQRSEVEYPVEEAPVYTGRIMNLSSPDNKTFNHFKKLLTARGIRKSGRAILAGNRIVEEALRDHPQVCKAWITQAGGPPPPEEAPEGMIWHCLEPALFRELDLFGTHAPLLLVEPEPLETWSADREPGKGCTLFVPFQDPENVGSVIRSAAAFGVSRVVLLKEAAHPYLPKACRAAGTGIFKVKLMIGPSIHEMTAGSQPLLTLTAEGKDIRDFNFPKSFGLLAGLEGMGLPDALRTVESLAIPMESGCESLNAAASVSVALYAWRSLKK